MDNLDFKTFFNERIRDKGISLQKLSELTNIAISHLENLSEGKYGELPPAPYLHGYIDKLALVLGFDPEDWWEELKRERSVKTSGVSDALPKNRYAKEFPVKIAVGILAALIVIILIAFRLPQILGVPTITLANPEAAVAVVSDPTFTFQGKVAGGDSLLINGENVPLNSDGTWTKIVSLQPGPNNFQITAKKLLGREVTIFRQILYETPATPSSTTTSTSTSAKTLPAPQSSSR